jgi:hypothetical protein
MLMMGAWAISSAEAAVDRAELAGDAIPPLASASLEVLDGVERITLDLTEAVDHVARRDGDELIIWFDQPRRFDLGALVGSTGSRFNGARVPTPGPSRWLVIDLAPGSDVLSDDRDGRRLVITLGGAEGEPSGAIRKRPERKGQTDTRPLETPAGESAPIMMKPVMAAKLSSSDDDGSENETASSRKRTEEEEGGTTRGPRPLMPKARPALVQKTSASPHNRPATPGETGEAVRRPAAAKSEPAARTEQASLPGQFEVDETALDRALERTLTREGAVLMPFGMIELEPSLSYTRRELDTPALINLFGFPGFGEANVTRSDYTASLALRVGLPFDAQFEVDAPFTYVDQSETVAIGFDPVTTVDDDAGAFGDLGVGLAKTLLKEGVWRPDVVARVRWDSHTGKSVENDIAFGGGAHELTGSLSLVKSQDPLAFFGSVSYEETFKEKDLDPGNRIGISVGTVLAASPETSLRASLRQDFISDAEFQNDTLEGTDQVAASLSIGASSVLGRGVLVDAAVDVGLTDDAADYAARISFPVRFDARPVLSSLGRRGSSSEADSETEKAQDDADGQDD